MRARMNISRIPAKEENLNELQAILIGPYSKFETGVQIRKVDLVGPRRDLSRLRLSRLASLNFHYYLCGLRFI